MHVGLIGGIAIGKTFIEKKFARNGYDVFDLDKVEWALRTGIVEYNKKDVIFSNKHLVDLTRELSLVVIKKMKREFPDMYTPEDGFRREVLLRYVNDDLEGAENHKKYEEIIKPFSKLIYLEWRQMRERPTVLSSAVILERNMAEYINKAYIIKGDKERQVINLIQREKRKGRRISYKNAMKAVNRQKDCFQVIEAIEKDFSHINIEVLDGCKIDHLENNMIAVNEWMLKIENF